MNHPVRSAAVIGRPEEGHGLLHALRSEAIEVRGGLILPESLLAGGGVPEAVDRVMVATVGLDPETLAEVALRCVDRSLPVWFDAAPLTELLDFLPSERIGGRLGVLLSGTAMRRYQRASDVIAGAAAITLLLPLLLVIAVLVKLSSRGPVLHRAVVVGQDGRPFTWYKFRTMREAGEDEAARRQRFAEFVRGGQTPAKIIEESRVTGVGAILRRHSLDELPQLLSVLRGDMTLLGPRPCLVYEYQLLKPWHRKRFAFRPGLTGLWQVRGRGRVHADEMALMDICYGLGRTWRTDLRVLWETVRVVLSGRGAA